MADREAEIQEWLRPITLKPGWRVEYAGSLPQGHYITVWATEPDVCNPGEVFTTAPLFRVSEEITTSAQFYDWLIDVCIPGVETHERWEWFRVNGEKWRDPHAPGMPAFATDFMRTFKQADNYAKPQAYIGAGAALVILVIILLIVVL